MESAVLRYLKDVASDPDTDVRCRAAEVLVHLLAQASPQWGTQLLVLINSILQKGLQVASRAIKDKVGGCGHMLVGVARCWWVWLKVAM